MRKFFLFETEVPAGSGFTLFGPCHLAWLFVIFIFIILGGKWYLKQSDLKQKRINRVFGIIFPVIAIYRDMVLFLTGHFDRGFLPFQLCSMAIWIAFLYIWTDSRFLGVIFVLLCVPGAAGALFFPNWEIYPFFNYMHIHAFISHGLITAFGIWQVAAGKIVPKWREFWMPMVFGIAGFVILYPINNWLGTNFWFLNVPSHGSPLIWIREITGDRWYRLGYFLFCMVVVAIWQLILSLVFYSGSGKRIFLKKQK